MLHTLLTLRNKGTKAMQAAGFIVVKISRILEKLLAFGLRVSGGVTDKYHCTWLTLKKIVITLPENRAKG